MDIIDNVTIAFILTFIAGMSACLGGCIIFFTDKSKNIDVFLGSSLAFSAGAMLYISFTEILSKAQNLLGGDTFGGFLRANLGFFAGITFMFLLGAILPEENTDSSLMKRAGIYTAVATAVHNFPEGLVTFMAVLGGAETALPTFFAIAIHNIPEGVAVALPTMYATNSKKRGFLMATMTAVAEPLGAVIGWFLLRPIMSDSVNGAVFAATAGIMVFLCFEELLPLAYKYCGEKKSLIFLVLGFLTIAISLLFMK